MLATLARASIDGAVFAGLIWLLARLVPRLSPGAKTFLWWLVSVKFLVALIWPAPIPLPVLPASQPSSIATATPAPAHDAVLVVVGGWPAPSSRRSGVLATLWGTGAALSLIVGWRRWRIVRNAIARSSGAPDAIHAMTRDVAARLRLPRIPDVRLSERIETPLVAGVLRPAIVVPRGRFERLGPDRQRMTICHELAHIKRRDLWFGAAVALAERLFFFHPLAHLAAREYVFWREAACDAAVIDALGATPHDYGRLLLDLGVSAPRRTLAAAGAAWSFGTLKRRIVMLGRPSSSSALSAGSRLAAAAAFIMAAAGLVPVTLTARTASPQPPATAAAPAPVHASVPASINHATVMATPAGDPQVETRPKPAPSEHIAFVMFHADGDTTMSGSTDEISRARQFRRPGEEMLWFRRDGTEYVVRDQAVLREVREIWKGVNEIGSQQGLLGAQQGVLGAQQGALGGRQGELGAQQGKLGMEQAALALREAALAQREAASKSPDDLAPLLRERAAIVEKNRDLTRLMHELQARIQELQAPMEELSKRMSAMSKDMDALSQQMAAASADAEAKMRDLIDRAIASGLARIVR